MSPVFVLTMIVVSYSPILYPNLLAPMSGSQGSIIYVPWEYDSINEAIENAAPGTLIIVKAGEYIEDISIERKSNIVLKGEGKVIISTDNRGLTLLNIKFSYNITVENLVFNGYGRDYTRYGVIHIEDSDTIAINNNVFLEKINGIVALDIRFSENIVFSGNNVSGFTGLRGSSFNGLTIYNNTFNVETLVSISRVNNTYIYFNEIHGDPAIYIGPYSNVEWSSPRKIVYGFNDQVFMSRIGNYWEDWVIGYNIGDRDNNGICDARYNTKYGFDNYPLKYPLKTYALLKPFIEITQPSEQELVSGEIVVSFKPYIPDLDKVVVKLNNNEYIVRGANQVRLNTLNYSDGYYQLTVLGFDKDNERYSDEIHVYIDNTPPIIKSLYIDNENGREPIIRWVVVEDYIDTQQLFINNTLLMESSNTTSYILDTSNLAPGKYVIILKVIDKTGHITTANTTYEKIIENTTKTSEYDDLSRIILLSLIIVTGVAMLSIFFLSKRTR